MCAISNRISINGTNFKVAKSNEKKTINDISESLANKLAQVSADGVIDDNEFEELKKSLPDIKNVAEQKINDIISLKRNFKLDLNTQDTSPAKSVSFNIQKKVNSTSNNIDESKNVNTENPNAPQKAPLDEVQEIINQYRDIIEQSKDVAEMPSEAQKDIKILEKILKNEKIDGLPTQVQDKLQSLLKKTNINPTQLLESLDDLKKVPEIDKVLSKANKVLKVGTKALKFLGGVGLVIDIAVTGPKKAKEYGFKQDPLSIVMAYGISLGEDFGKLLKDVGGKFEQKGKEWVIEAKKMLELKGLSNKASAVAYFALGKVTQGLGYCITKVGEGVTWAVNGVKDWFRDAINFNMKDLIIEQQKKVISKAIGEIRKVTVELKEQIGEESYHRTRAQSSRARANKIKGVRDEIAQLDKQIKSLSENGASKKEITSLKKDLELAKKYVSELVNKAKEESSKSSKEAQDMENKKTLLKVLRSVGIEEAYNHTYLKSS